MYSFVNFIKSAEKKHQNMLGCKQVEIPSFCKNVNVCMPIINIAIDFKKLCMHNLYATNP